MRLPKPLGGPRRAWFIQLALLAGIELGSLLCLALGLRHAFDVALVDGPAEVGRSSLAWLLFGLALVLASALARGLQRPLGERFAQHYARRVRSRVLRRWLRQVAVEREPRGRGTLLVRLMGDAGALSRWHGRVMARTIANVTALVVVTIVLAVMAWPLACAVMGPLLLGVIGQWWAGYRLEASAGRARQQRSRLAASVARLLDTAGASSRAAVIDPVADLDRRGRRLGTGMIEAARHSGWIEAFGYAMTGGALVMALVVGTWLAAAGRITPGTVLLASLWVGHFSRPVHELARAQDAWRRARVSRRKLEGFLGAMGAVDSAPTRASGPAASKANREERES